MASNSCRDGDALINPRFVCQTQYPKGLQYSQCAQGITVGGVLRRFKTHRHMAVGTKVVDLIGLHLLDDPDQVGAICEIAVMKDQPGVVLMGVLIKVIDPGGVETACSSLNPMHRIALL